MVLDSGPIIKRLFTTLVVSFGMTSSSASTVSDSLPVCSIERLPTPLSSTASKPLTFLDSCVSFAGLFVLPFALWVLVLCEEVTCEVEEVPPLDLDAEDVAVEMLPSSYVRFKVPPLILCAEWVFSPTVSSTCRSPFEPISQSSDLPLRL